MIELQRTDSSHVDFIALVKQLDAYLKITDGDEHDFYNQFNSIERLHHVVLAYVDQKPVGCGAFKAFDASRVEIKRMFTLPEARGKGVASTILEALEQWALELGYTSTILETGKRQVEAVNFYKKCQYVSIPKYGQYKAMENSLCFEKSLMKSYNTNWAQIKKIEFPAFQDFVVIESKKEKLTVHKDEFEDIFQQYFRHYQKGGLNYISVFKDWNECIGFNDDKINQPSIIVDIEDLIDALGLIEGSEKEELFKISALDLKLIIDFLNRNKNLELAIRQD